MKKILIAYFSHPGQNYFRGELRILSKGNTQVAAEITERLTRGSLFRIDTAKEYPTDYSACTRVAKTEQEQRARPALTANVEDMSLYGTVILGYPNWWGSMPMAVYTFLESYDFSGKTILPFCTNEGSGMGSSETDIKNVCPDARVSHGLAIQGSQAASARKLLASWLIANGIPVFEKEKN